MSSYSTFTSFVRNLDNDIFKNTMGFSVIASFKMAYVVENSVDIISTEFSCISWTNLLTYFCRLFLPQVIILDAKLSKFNICSL